MPHSINLHSAEVDRKGSVLWAHLRLSSNECANNSRQSADRPPSIVPLRWAMRPPDECEVQTGGRQCSHLLSDLSPSTKRFPLFAFLPAIVIIFRMHEMASPCKKV